MAKFDRSLIRKNTTKYTNKHTQFDFLLGGIGTGCVSMDSRGAFGNFEIFNNPNKGKHYPYSFFSIATKFDGEKRKINILEAKHNVPYNVNFPDGYPRNLLAGVPRFDRTIATGKGGILNIDFYKKTLPLDIKLCAYSPIIPGDDDNSGIPAISFKYRVKNTSDKNVEVSLCYTQTNYTHHHGFNQFNELLIDKKMINETFENKHLKGVYMTSDEDKNSEYYGNMSIATSHKDASIKARWNKGGWNDSCQSFFNDILEDGLLDSECTRVKNEDAPLEFISPSETGSIVIKKTLAPGEESVFDFYLSWSFPNRAKNWKGHICPTRDYKGETVKNYYAYKFKDATDAATYLCKNDKKLYKASLNFVDALYSSNVGKHIIEAINNTLNVIKSPTCFRINEGGDFLAWEGCFLDRGSCEGSCTHVWNYAQTLQYLFPRLEKSMLKISFLQETDENGYMAFRAMQILGDEKWDMLPALDGQFGMISRLYRNYAFTGNDDCIKECFDSMNKVLSYSFENWDKERKGVIVGKQHNTYDIEFFGISSMINSLYHTALISSSEIAKHFNSTELSDEYLNIYHKGKKYIDDQLFDGYCYVQNIDDVNSHKYQYGKGVLSDQLFGQTLAYINGFSHLYNENNVRQALKAVYESNFLTTLEEHLNIQRTYALNDDSGLILCSWKNDKDRPAFPFPYSDEIWTGIEYQVATSLYYQDESLLADNIVKAINERHNGYNRNPFNQIECGNHYARSLASYGLLLGKIGLIYRMMENKIYVKKSAQPIQAFIAFEKGFGMLYVNHHEARIEKIHGFIPTVDIELY